MERPVSSTLPCHPNAQKFQKTIQRRPGTTTSHPPIVLFGPRNMHRFAFAAGSVTSIISETVVLIAARVCLKGQASSAASVRSLLALISLKPIPAHRVARLALKGGSPRGTGVLWINIRSIVLRASVQVASGRVGRVVDKCCLFLRPNHQACCICNQMHAQEYGAPVELADSCTVCRCKTTRGPLWALDVWCMLCVQRVPTAW